MCILKTWWEQNMANFTPSEHPEDPQLLSVSFLSKTSKAHMSNIMLSDKLILQYTILYSKRYGMLLLRAYYVI